MQREGEPLRMVVRKGVTAGAAAAAPLDLDHPS
jgi:hypothetical protein